MDLIKSEQTEVDESSLQHKTQEYSCKECDYRSNNSSYLWWHVEAIHTENKTLKCNYCDIKVTTKFNLNRHMKTIHKAKYNLERQMEIFQEAYNKLSGIQEVKNKFSCQYCEKSYTRKDHLVSHEKSKHIEKIEYLCKLCDYKTKASKHHLKRHVLSVHEGKTFSCDYCDVKMRRKDFIKRHVQSVHFSLTVKCDKCKKEFRRQDLLNLHTKFEHEGEIFGHCEKCKREFRRKAHLRRHEKSCKGKIPETKSFACNFCNYEASKQNLIRRHILSKHEKDKDGIYTDIKPNNHNKKTIQSVDEQISEKNLEGNHEQSKNSTYKFMENINQQNVYLIKKKTDEKKSESSKENKMKKPKSCNMQKETGTIPKCKDKQENTLFIVERFACNFCDYETSKDKSIIRHIARNHKENKMTIFDSKKKANVNESNAYEFKYCSICEFKSKKVRNLKRHIETVHNIRKFKCDYCEIEFGRKDYINKHVRSVHEGEVFSCEHCGSKFKRKDHLKRHISNFHFAQNAKKSCNFCDFKASKRIHIRKHVMSEHQDKLFHRKQIT